jgi:hypothetical protein
MQANARGQGKVYENFFSFRDSLQNKSAAYILILRNADTF